MPDPSVPLPQNPRAWRLRLWPGILLVALIVLLVRRFVALKFFALRMGGKTLLFLSRILLGRPVGDVMYE